jgi:ribosomal protein S18 acetylase RimI-like enzyme
MKTGARETAAVLKARPLGAGLWIRGLGASMAPLLRSGDALFVLRCEPAEVRRGDLVLMLGAQDQLIAHLVQEASPLRTTSFLGRQDPEGLSVLGRVTRVRRGGVVVPLPRLARGTMWFMHRLATAMARREAAKSGVRRGLAWARSAWTAPARRAWFGPVTVRALTADDVEQALLFCGDWLSLDAGFMQRQLLQRWSRGLGAGAGAFARSGRLVGFGFLDEYQQEGASIEGWWIRYLFVSPWARGLGLAAQVVACLCEQAAKQGLPLIHADVRRENFPSVALFNQLGFSERPELGVRLANMRGEQDGARWVWFEAAPGDVVRVVSSREG